MTTGAHELVSLFVGMAGSLATSPFGPAAFPQSYLQNPDPAGYTLEITSPSGETRGQIRSGNGSTIDIEKLPAHFLNAVIAIEDGRFLEHNGLDPKGLIAAAISSARGDVRGGSTITQQMVKNTYTGNAPTLARKIIEANIALHVHAAYGPRGVLERYLKTAWFGRGIRGIEDAPIVLFGAPWDEATLAQSALIAGMLKGASAYDPRRHPEKALKRRNLVLARMLQLGWISSEEHEKALQEPLNLADPQKPGVGASNTWEAQALTRALTRHPSRPDNGQVLSSIEDYWQDLTTDVVQKALYRAAPYAPDRRIPPENIDRFASMGHLPESLSLAAPADRSLTAALLVENGPEGWTILTHQEKLENVTLKEPYAKYEPSTGDVVYLSFENGISEATIHLKSDIEAAAVVIDVTEKSVLATVGGIDSRISGYDRTMALRQPGSTVKPFLWLSALENGYDATTFTQDIEKTYVMADGETWHPKNYDHSQSGYIPLYTALEWSSNLVAAGLVNDLGTYPMKTLAESAGAYRVGHFKDVPSSALGASETTLFDLVSGFSTLAAGGWPVFPDPVVAFASGKAEEPQYPTRIQTPPIADQISINELISMMRGVVTRGTAMRAFEGNPVTVAGKSGTSQDNRDALFIGITPDLAIGVWVGRDDNAPLPKGFTGGQISAPMVAHIFERAYKEGRIDAQGRFHQTPPAIIWPPIPPESEAFEMMQETSEMPIATRHLDPNEDLLMLFRMMQ